MKDHIVFQGEIIVQKSYSYLKSYSPESLGQFEPNLAQSIPKWTELHNIQMEGHALFLWPGDPRLRGILFLSCLSFCYSETLKLKTSEMFLSVPITGTAQCYASLPSNFHEYLWCHDAGKVVHTYTQTYVKDWCSLITATVCAY